MGRKVVNLRSACVFGRERERGKREERGRRRKAKKDVCVCLWCYLLIVSIGLEVKLWDVVGARYMMDREEDIKEPL